MSVTAIEKDSARAVKKIMTSFASTIGNSKKEALCWGVKTSPEMQLEIATVLAKTVTEIGGDKIRGVMVLAQQAKMVGNRTPELKAIPKSHVVYIPNAESLRQDSLLQVILQSSQAGCKAMIGFSTPSKLSLGIYQFLVTKQITDGIVTDWAINMDMPICDIQ
ncbi:hypothetical protein [Providencia rettgeri]|uniref:hypothetical protein n=1 Tax=Providencia rettgeri TaxID=587 RepID=UPI001374446F|nr:hypothetical protein [Providencia rettgeri]BBV14502.1 hypothetical protein BML2531_43680 [Providencia rettgeri]